MEDNVAITKRCCRCHKIKFLDEFNKNKTTKDGFRGQCRACDCIDTKSRKIKYSGNVLEDTKRCGKCNKIKLTIEFSKNKRKRDGLNNWCKSCYKEYATCRNYVYPGNLFKDTKICKTCNEEKLVCEFHRNSQHKDGLCNECKSCSLAKHVLYSREHKREKAEYDAKYRIKNIDKIKAWEKANADKIKIKVSRRASRKRNLPHDLTTHEWKYILEYYDHCCAYCGKSEFDNGGVLEQEHIIPVICGGGYTALNIVPACTPCNLFKGPRKPHEIGMMLRKPQPIVQLNLFNVGANYGN